MRWSRCWLALGIVAAMAVAPHAQAQATDPPAEVPPPASDDPSRARTGANAPTGAASPTAPGRTGDANEAESAASANAPVVPVPAAANGSSPKRELPDFDGRGEPPTTAGDVLLWVPRVVFAPFYFVSEFVIRRPLAWLITTAERKQWPTAIRDFFLFGPDKKAGIVPTAFLDFGFRASVGFYAFWDDLLGKGNHLRLHASTLGVDWLQGAIADKIPVGKKSFFDLRLEGIHRPDYVFHGMGPRTLQGDRMRFGIDQVQGKTVFETFWWKGSRATIEGGVRYVDFRDDACCEDPSVVSQVRAGRFPAPPGFDAGYTAAFQRAELTVDSRDERPASQTGVRLELQAEQGSNVRRSTDNWIKYGASAGAFLDVKNNRTLSLSATTLFVDPVSDGATIPFTEQIVLGGSGPMRGYLYGRLVDRSAAIATLKYRWPIWIFLDGTMQASVGNVYGAGLRDFEAKLLRFSGAVGIESIGSADHTFEFLFGLGSETFDQGASLNSVRLLFGTNRGF